MTSGPRCIEGGGMRGWILTSIVLWAGCASGSAAPPSPAPETAQPEAAPPERSVDREGLDRASEAHDSGDRLEAATLADSVWGAWVGSEWVDADAAEDLVDLLADLGDEYRAVEFLVRAPFELGGGLRKRARDLSAVLSIAELESLDEIETDRSEARSIVETELAVALAQAGRPDRARSLARQVLSGSPDGDERERAEDVADGGVEPLEGPVRVGVVLPRSGRFSAVGDQILEGVLLALDERGVEPGSASVELEIMDDSSRVEVGIEHVEELEKQQVVAVLGPLRTEALESGAIRRKQDDLLILSPTATGGQGGELNVYTLWDRQRREVDVAGALLAWMVGEMEIGTFGILYPDDADATVEILRDQARELGVDILAAQAYDADSTTFGQPIGALAEVEPDAVVVLSDRARTVLQLAPQLVYYGLRRWVIGGDAAWSDPRVVRRLDASYADYRLVSTYVDQISPGTEWQQFKADYEAKYRKTLSDNMFTALGYDAMRLILEGVPEVDPARRGAIGRSIRRNTYAGATGDISVDPLTGELHRQVFVRVILDGELRVPVAEDMVEWAAQQLELEEFLKALEEEKEQEQEADEGGGR